jgi:hypothetical protein
MPVPAHNVRYLGHNGLPVIRNHGLKIPHCVRDRGQKSIFSASMPCSAPRKTVLKTQQHYDIT